MSRLNKILSADIPSNAISHEYRDNISLLSIQMTEFKREPFDAILHAVSDPESDESIFQFELTLDTESLSFENALHVVGGLLKQVRFFSKDGSNDPESERGHYIASGIKDVEPDAYNEVMTYLSNLEIIASRWGTDDEPAILEEKAAQERPQLKMLFFKRLVEKGLFEGVTNKRVQEAMYTLVPTIYFSSNKLVFKMKSINFAHYLLTKDAYSIPKGVVQR